MQRKGTEQRRSLASDGLAQSVCGYHRRQHASHCHEPSPRALRTSRRAAHGGPRARRRRRAARRPGRPGARRRRSCTAAAPRARCTRDRRRRAAREAAPGRCTTLRARVPRRRRRRAAQGGAAQALELGPTPAGRPRVLPPDPLSGFWGALRFRLVRIGTGRCDDTPSVPTGRIGRRRPPNRPFRLGPCSEPGATPRATPDETARETATRSACGRRPRRPWRLA